MINEIICPYCGTEKDTSQEEVGEMLYEMKTECNNILFCSVCDKEFEVCVQVDYKFNTHKRDIKD